MKTQQTSLQAWWADLPSTKAGSILNLGIRCLLFPLFLSYELLRLSSRLVEEEPDRYGLVQGGGPCCLLILSRFRACLVQGSVALFLQAVLYVMTLDLLAICGLQHVVRNFRSELEAAAAALSGVWYVTKDGKQYPSAPSSGDVHHRLPGGHCLGRHSSLCTAAGAGDTVACPCRASFLAACCTLVYEAEPVICDVLTHRWGLRLLAYKHIPADLHKGRDYVPDVVWFAAASEHGLVIAFAGAQVFNKIDRGTDIPTAMSEYPGCGRMTDGFVRGLEQRVRSCTDASVYDDLHAFLLSSCDEKTEIFLTGHSIGGAGIVTFAQLLAVRNPDLAQRITGIFTYGAPRVGNGQCSSLLRQRFTGRLVRYVNCSDMVCKLPHVYQGCQYVHHCGERFITSFTVPRLGHRVLTEEDEPKLLAVLEKQEEEYAYLYGLLKLLAAPFQEGRAKFWARLSFILLPGLMDHFPVEYQAALDQALLTPTKERVRIPWQFDAVTADLQQALTPLKRLLSSPARLLATPNMAATKSVEDPYTINNDGSAKDPAAFQQALRADESKMKDLQSEPEVIKIVLGQDLQAFQELLKTVYAAEKKRLARASQTMAERTIDAQRASATVPRDTVQLYAQLRESGLQYGPAFRLLRNVHTPDTDNT